MFLTLKSKRAFTDDAVSRVWSDITQHVSETEARDAIEQAARETRETCGRDLDRCVYGWSGGKDSLALQAVMDQAGAHRSVIGLIPSLEWTAYLAWIRAHAPAGLTTIANHALDIHWLAHPGNDRYLFPRTSRDGYFWTLAGTRRAQIRYQRDHEPPLQIYGRRTQDGNICGNRHGGITRGNGITSYNPIRRWPHELVLAVIHYTGLTLPPVYSWPSGWTAGTGSWPGRRVGTRDESWAQTHAIEPDRVHEAATAIPSAADWLRRNT